MCYGSLEAVSYTHLDVYKRQDTYGELKNESSITLVSLYPDLKSDELVKKQIEVYESNNKEIREMKEKKINLKVLKWWLYFGK